LCLKQKLYAATANHVKYLLFSVEVRLISSVLTHVFVAS
jgi:hypothetical protein